MKNFVIIFEKNEQKHFAAYVPDLPGCFSFGDTLAEAKNNIREAIHLHIEGLEAEKMTIPRQKTYIEVLSVAV